MIVTWPVFFLESQDSEYAKLSEKEQSRDIKKAEMSPDQKKSSKLSPSLF